MNNEQKLPGVDNRSKQTNQSLAQLASDTLNKSSKKTNQNITPQFGNAFGVVANGRQLAPMPAMANVPPSNYAPSRKKQKLAQPEASPVQKLNPFNLPPGKNISDANLTPDRALQSAAKLKQQAPKAFADEDAGDIARRLLHTQERFAGTDGVIGQVNSRADVINARTDLTPEQKNDFLQKAYARRFAKGSSLPPNVRIDEGNPDVRDAVQQRQERRQAALGRAAQQQMQMANQQQQQAFGQLAQQALMGNNNAARILEQWNEQQGRAMAINANQQAANADRQLKQFQIDAKNQLNRASLDYRQQQHQDTLGQAAQQAANQERLNRAELRLKQLAEERANADSEAKRRLIDEEIKTEQANRDTLSNAAIPNDEQAFGDALKAMQRGRPFATAITGFNEARMARSLWDAGNEGQALLRLPPTTVTKPETAPPSTLAEDYISRLDKTFQFSDSEDNTVNPQLAAIAAQLNGVTKQGLQTYRNELKKQLPSGPIAPDDRRAWLVRRFNLIEQILEQEF